MQQKLLSISSWTKRQNRNTKEEEEGEGSKGRYSEEWITVVTLLFAVTSDVQLLNFNMLVTLFHTVSGD